MRLRSGHSTNGVLVLVKPVAKPTAKPVTPALVKTIDMPNPIPKPNSKKTAKQAELPKVDMIKMQSNEYKAEMLTSKTKFASDKTFIGSVIYFGEIFEINIKHFDNLKSYDPKGGLSQLVLSRVKHWFDNIGKKIISHILDNDLGDAEKVFAEIRKTNASGETLIKKLEDDKFRGVSV